MLREFEVDVMLKMMRAKERVCEAVKDFFTDEEGDTNMISIILVLVIVVALAIVFRKNIANLVNTWWEKIFKDANAATNTNGTHTQFE